MFLLLRALFSRDPARRAEIQAERERLRRERDLEEQERRLSEHWEGLNERQPCPACGGSGACTLCAGSPVGWDDDRPDACAHCRGTGRCPDCGGTGWR